MSTIPNVTLNSGALMPQIGFGVFQVPDDETTAAVSSALEAGYRSIDTAAVYGNEVGTGKAIAESGIAREDLFVTTKLWISDLGRKTAPDALAASLDKLGLDSVDLYLIHWPAPEKGLYLETWEALEELQAAGLTKSIGVSNFLPEHIEKVVALGGTIPAVNQIELHPLMQNRESVAANRKHGIVTEAWSPLAQAGALSDPAVTAIADSHGVSPAQVVLRWHVQNGTVAIPKSVTPARIASNLDVFGFELTEAEMNAVNGMETGVRIGPNPNDLNG